MSTAEAIGAILVMVWVYLIIGMVAAFVLSYLAGSTTTIYYLLRRKVDATDFDEVYVEEEEEQAQMPAPQQAQHAEPEQPSEAQAEGETQASAEEEAAPPEEKETDDDSGQGR